MAVWILGGVVVTIIVVAAVALCIASMKLLDDHRTILGVLAGAASLAVVIIPAFIVVGAVEWEPEREHRWKGGSGPATVCEFQSVGEQRMAGKVFYTEHVTYTVCRDAS